MSSLSAILAPLSQLSFSAETPALPLTVAFALALVGWLVAVEESEMRRGRRSPDGPSA